jgi:hypothetical protein
MRFRTNFLASASLLFSSSLLMATEKPLIDQIMEKVAANQDRAEQMRREFVYRQTVVIRVTRANGRLAREELRELQVAPTPEQTEKTLLRFLGKYEKDGKLLEYAEPGFHHKELDLDGELIKLAEELTNDKQSRDGIARDLFPLTSHQQSRYRFNLKGDEVHRGRTVYRIAFEPRGNGWEENEGAPWAGEVLVDQVEYQPVLVTTRLAKDFPLAVKVFLGTDVQRLGFKVAYEKLGEGIWFPVSYGGEFKLKVIFFYKRNIAIALSNSDFERTAVSTRLVFDNLLEIAQPLRLPEMPSGSEISTKSK